MNKRAQGDWGEIIKFIILAPILIAFLGAMFAIINQPNCPTCDCSTYQNQFEQCKEMVKNLSKQINETPIQYIQNITYVEKPVEKIIYQERTVPVIVNIVALILSLGITISLFRIKVKLPKELEAKIIKIERWILWVKWASFILTLLIFIRIVLVLL